MSGSSQQNPRPADALEILEKLARLPISTWNYKTDDPSVRHIGPMAQDFREAFGVGSSDKVIHTEDVMGVAFASIQALKTILEQQGEKLSELQESLHRLDAERRGRG